MTTSDIDITATLLPCLALADIETIIKDVYLTFPKMDGWMACNFTCFSTVFQSYKYEGG